MEGEQSAFAALMDLIGQMNQQSEPGVIDNALVEIARAKLSKIEIDRLLRGIRANTGTTLTALREGLTEQRKNQSDGQVDIPYLVMKKLLKEHFAGGRYLIRGPDKSFWAYNGQHWQMLKDERLENLLIGIVEEMVPEGGNYRTHMKYAFDLLVAESARFHDRLLNPDHIMPVINVQNGELWIDTDGSASLRPHSPESCLISVLNIAYDPAATCPRFDQAMLDIFARASDPADMVRHMEEIMGYIIQPRRFIASFFVWIGDGSNGKTQLSNILIELLGPSNVHADRIGNLKTNRFIFGSLVWKSLFLDDDMRAGEELSDDLIKMLSEAKRMAGERKFKDVFEYVSRIALLILCNDYPRLADLSHGMRRRMQIVPFERIFGNKDRDDTLFPDIIAKELPGVLNRLLAGFQRLTLRGRFEEPEDCLLAKAEWIRQANPLPSFIAEICRENAQARVRVRDLYHRYRDWCGDNGIRQPLTKQELHRNLSKLGYKTVTRDGYPCIQGLELATTCAPYYNK